MTARALAALAEKLGERIALDEETRARYASDFGRIVHRLPGAVARCAGAEEVAEVVQHCREHGISVVARGEGHSQAGQSTTEGGVVIDTTAMRTIHTIDVAGLTATADGGVLWRDLVEQSLAHGLVPPVLTNNLAVTLAGTISIAGVGVTSYRYGTQADNVTELEVVTGTGEIVTCSRAENPDLFDVVRCGLGQFGIITRVTTRLRRCAPQMRMYHLLYDDLGALMDDAAVIMRPDNHARFHGLEARCAPCPIFTKRIGPGMDLGTGRQLYAHWMFPLFLFVEYGDDAPDDATVLAGFRHYRHLLTEDLSQAEYCNRLLPVFELWRRSGYWDMSHPWVEATLPWEAARRLLPMVLENLPPQALGPGGQILLWPARADTSAAPLFRYPDSAPDLEPNLMGVGIMPGVPSALKEQALAQAALLHQLTVASGGTRYLSGWVSFDSTQQWQAHFGADAWRRILEAKAKYDPDGVLSSEFVRYA